MTPFFITGLPRTRSAWMANLLTTDRTVCFHDPRESVSRLIDTHPELRVGVADSTLPLKWPLLAGKYPEAPWLYIERDPSEAMRSFVKFTRGHVRLFGSDMRRFWALHQRAAAEMKAGCGRLLVVEFARLGEPATIEQVWQHLVPEIELSPVRLAILENLQIEQRLVNRVRDLPDMVRANLGSVA